MDSIIDAKGCIAGRIATVVAKKAMLGETVNVVNAEQAIISGRKKFTIEKFLNRRSRGIPLKGPYYPRQADRLLKRIIRGMIPHRQHKGRTALARVKCHIGIPKAFEDKKIEVVEGASATKLPNMKYISLQELSRELGAKQ